jgi:hypothetical protein
MKILNDAVAFIIELAMLIALSISGYQLATAALLQYSFAILLPLAAILLWAVWAAPRSKRRLPFPWLSVFKFMLFSITTILLFRSGHSIAGIVFGTVAYANELLAVLLSRSRST